ncbi:MAG: hypothetical protein M0Z91_07510 [Actinomycetota bacterium]|nr:hypothetical protein [Actinomycetota bacterium]
MTSPFYSSDQTDQSRIVLDDLLSAVPNAILIGGWGTWARVGGAMSHDIDLIVSRDDLTLIGGMVDELSESGHLGGTKWRGTWRGIHIDLYAPYSSRLGTNLQLLVERLPRHAELLAGRRLLSVPAHIATKMAALLDRSHSLPGSKDRYELLKLLALPTASSAPQVIKEASSRTTTELATLIDRSFELLQSDPGVNRNRRAGLRSMAREWRLVLDLELPDVQLPRAEQAPDLGF